MARGRLALAFVVQRVLDLRNPFNSVLFSLSLSLSQESVEQQREECVKQQEEESVEQQQQERAEQQQEESAKQQRREKSVEKSRAA